LSKRDEVKLTKLEFDLLALLVRNRDRVLTHQYLLKEVWGPGSANEPHYVRVFMANLRKKLEKNPSRPQFLITEQGIGYRLQSQSILPQAQLSGASRPTLSYTPLDDEEFTRRLFSPISLEGAAYLSKTTWPISTVFRLYLENLNWISNAETASGPTPATPPDYAVFLEGVQALQRLQDRKLITLFTEEREEVVSTTFPLNESSIANSIESIQNDLELKSSKEGVSLIRRKNQPVLRVDPMVGDDQDWMAFCNAFKLNPSIRTFDLTAEKLDPFLKDMPPTGLETLDLETRSLLQVLFFVSQGVDVPKEHLISGVAPRTNDFDGRNFNWQQVLGGLFRVCSVKSKKKPDCAYVAIQYKGYWYYIDERDRDTKATFALLLEVSRLELESTKSKAPILTIPLGG
jgi:DNA-binding winged helix-turn-helix (wHTH) protein